MVLQVMISCLQTINNPSPIFLKSIEDLLSALTSSYNSHYTFKSEIQRSANV